MKVARKAAAHAEAKPKVELSGVVRVGVAAWLIPGLGHWLLRRRWRGLILFAAIAAMFLLGLGMHGQIFAAGTASYLKTLGYFGELCVGLPMPLAKFFNYAGDPFFISADYGTAYLVSAGMLNALAVLDACDICLERKA